MIEVSEKAKRERGVVREGEACLIEFLKLYRGLQNDHLLLLMSLDEGHRLTLE